MLIFDLVITPEWDTLPIHSSQSGKQSGLWMSIGLEGKISSGTRYAWRSQGIVWILVS